MTTKKRTKKAVVTGVSREDADMAMSSYAKAQAEADKLTAEMELKIAEIRDQYAGRLSVLEAQRGLAFELLQVYATENAEKLFAKRKSVEMTHGTMGFRTGTPKLKPLTGFTWDKVKLLVGKVLPDYIRTTEEVAKDRLLADRDSVKEKLCSVGLRVVQDESFYVEPKSEEPSADA